MKDEFALTLEQTCALIRGKVLFMEGCEKELESKPWWSVFGLYKVYGELYRLHRKLSVLHALKFHHHDFVVQTLERKDGKSA